MKKFIPLLSLIPVLIFAIPTGYHIFMYVTFGEYVSLERIAVGLAMSVILIIPTIALGAYLENNINNND